MATGCTSVAIDFLRVCFNMFVRYFLVSHGCENNFYKPKKKKKLNNRHFTRKLKTNKSEQVTEGKMRKLR